MIIKGRKKRGTFVELNVVLLVESSDGKQNAHTRLTTTKTTQSPTQRHGKKGRRSVRTNDGMIEKRENGRV